MSFKDLGIDINTDSGMDKLFGLLAIKIRREVVASLLVGNDTQCFTTEQYLSAYIRDKNGSSMMDLALAERHLQRLPEMREVKPGIWIRSKDTGP